MIIDGYVESGKHLGRTLGFPTANIAPERVTGAWPENGVYAAAVWIDGDAKARPAMLNQGVHPTAPEGKPTVEANLPGFSGDLYGRRVRVEYLKFLRPERRFESLDALTDQLARDREALLDWIEAARRGEDGSPEAVRAREIGWSEELGVRSEELESEL